MRPGRAGQLHPLSPDAGISILVLVMNAAETCVGCSRPLAGRTALTFGYELRCLRCAVRQKTLLRRSALTSLVVGSILATINQGLALVAGHVQPGQIAQVALNYAVPFCVATWGALINSRR